MSIVTDPGLSHIGRVDFDPEHPRPRRCAAPGEVSSRPLGEAGGGSLEAALGSSIDPVQGTEAWAAAAALDFDHGQPQWSPDGRYLLYHRFPLRGPDIVLSLWVLDVETGEQVEIIRPGQRPIWWP